jgi:hypothetical protein
VLLEYVVAIATQARGSVDADVDFESCGIGSGVDDD